MLVVASIRQMREAMLCPGKKQRRGAIRKELNSPPNIIIQKTLKVLYKV